MLTAAFPKLGESKYIRYLCDFYRSPFYAFLIAALMAFAEIFALELAVYWIYLVLGCLCLLLADDTTGIMPIGCCGYMTFAYVNSAHLHPEGTFFSDPAHLLQLFFIVGVAAIMLIGRLVTFVMTHPRRQTPSRNALIYGALQIVSLCGLYFYFYFTIDWKNTDKSYLFMLFIMIGVGLLAEIAEMYTHEGVFTRNESGIITVNRGKLGTGWGVYNNVGCMMAMCIPAPFYFAAKEEKQGWAYALLGSLFMIGVAFTQSRGSILFGAVVYAACALAVLIQAKGRNRIGIFCVFGALLLILLVGLLCFRERLGGIFSAFASSGMDSSGRLKLYKGCWEKFLERPLFGVGFHNLGGENNAGYAHLKDSLLIPPRAHNTIFQLLASGGIVALLAYAFHRAQTVWLWLREPSYEKTIIALIISALLLTSLLDCHFFNYGPGLLYGVALAFAECTERGRKRAGLPRRKRGRFLPL